MLTGYNWTRTEIIKLKEDHPTLYQKVTDKLKTIPVNQKVLRWPDGNESIIENKPFTPETDKIFTDLCNDGEVEKTVLRCNLNMMDTSIDCYERLINEGVDVVYVEAGNEPYFSPQSDISIAEWFGLFFDWKQWGVPMDIRITRYNAKKYANKVKELKGKFAERGYNITSKIGYAVPIPRYYADKEWLRICQTILPTSQFPIVTVHLYNSDMHEELWPSWLSEIKTALRHIKGKGLRFKVTEGNAIHFGKDGLTDNVELANTPYHVEKNIELLRTVKEEGGELYQYHKLGGFIPERLFHKWHLDIPRLTLTDRQPEFTLNPNV